MTPQTPNLADAICEVLISPNEADCNLEPANVVDGLFAIARAIDRLAVAIKQSQAPASRGRRPDLGNDKR